MTTLPTICRDRHGIPHIDAADDAAMFFGQGMAHATDRALQMLLLRLIGKGRVSEVLDSSDDALRVDQFFRRLNWSGNTRSPLEKLSPSAWFGGRTREDIFRQASAVVLQSPPRKWGEVQQFVMTNIFFNG